MSALLEYKGYYGSTGVSVEDGVLFGKILFIDDLVTYEGEDVNELKSAFEQEVDDYIEYCEKTGKTPEKAFKGVFNVRITPELHKALSIEAAKRNITLNQLVSTALAHEVSA